MHSLHNKQYIRSKKNKNSLLTVCAATSSKLWLTNIWAPDDENLS